MKYKINSRVIASQSINEYSFNKQEKHNHISRLGIGTVAVTVQCRVNKNKHWKYWLKIPAETWYLEPYWTEYNQLKCYFRLLKVFYTKMYFNYTKYIPIVFQLQNTNYFCQGLNIQNTLNVFKMHVFQLFVFQLLQHCSVTALYSVTS